MTIWQEHLSSTLGILRLSTPRMLAPRPVYTVIHRVSVQRFAVWWIPFGGLRCAYPPYRYSASAVVGWMRRATITWVIARWPRRAVIHYVYLVPRTT